MNTLCPHCEVRFKKEPGYFVGAMIASYFLGILLLTPTLLLCLFVLELEFPVGIGIGLAELLLLQPLLFRVSRLIWIQAEYRLTQSIHS